MNKRISILAAVIIGILTIANSLMLYQQSASAAKLSAAGAPQFINYQGRLTDAAGNPITGERQMIFRFYPEATGGTALWNESLSVSINNGVFDVLLGIPSTFFDGSNRYLGVTVGNDAEMTPRRQVASVPYAYWAEEAARADEAASADSATTANYATSAGDAEQADHAFALSAPDGEPQDALVVDDEGKVGIGTTTPEATLEISGSIKFGGRTIQRITSCRFVGTPNSNGDSKWHHWVAGECDNGLPQGNCLAFPTKFSQCGFDRNWRTLLPGENGAIHGGIAWWNSACGEANLEVGYFCSE